jgi:hypothetical protein
MAKTQDLPLNPMKISGVCGRLLCCLGYECEQYRQIKEKMPREGTRVATDSGIGVIVGQNAIGEKVMVEFETGARLEMPLSRIKILEPPQAPKPAGTPPSPRPLPVQNAVIPPLPTPPAPPCMVPGETAAEGELEEELPPETEPPAL